MLNIVSEAKKSGIAVEINNNSKNVMDVFACCIENDCPMTFGTDSHDLKDIGIYNFESFMDVLTSLTTV